MSLRRERGEHLGGRAWRTRWRIAGASLAGGLALSACLAPVQTTSIGDGEVEILRDEWGVPHIHAATERDAFFGLGYAQAQDQLPFLLRLLATQRGELAARVGPDAVESDLEQRRWLHVEASRADFAELDARVQELYAAWVAGVERYLEEHPEDDLDPPFDLEPWDPLVLSRGLLWPYYYAGDGLAEARGAGLRLSATIEDALARRESLASNAWALAPGRTRDGAAMLLSDPHGPIDGSLFYESVLHAGDLHVAAYGLGPLLLLGHTRHLAWGMTTGGPDVSDCYELELDEYVPSIYRFGDDFRELQSRELEVAVAGAEPVRRSFDYAECNGIPSPVVARRDGRAYAVCSPYVQGAGRLHDEVYRLLRAERVEEVPGILATLGMFAQNLVFADEAGGLLYVRAGRTPRRAPEYDWTRPVPGDRPETEWRGLHPVEDLLQVSRPGAGFLQNDNVAPDVVLGDDGPSAPAEAPWLFHDRAGRTTSRGTRTVEVLGAAEGFAFEQAIELALDETWPGIERWQELLRRARELAGDATGIRPAFAAALDGMLAFDGRACRESAVALAFVHWAEVLRKRFAAPRLEALVRDPARLTPREADELIAALVAGLERIDERHGRLDVPLGEEVRLVGAECDVPLGGATLAFADGSALDLDPLLWIETQRAFDHGGPDERGRRVAQYGSRCLRLVQFTDPIRSFTLHNFGQSLRDGSPHRSDQAVLSSERRLKPTRFDAGRGRGWVRSRIVLRTRT